MLSRLLRPGRRGIEDHTLIAQLLLAQRPEVDGDPRGWIAGLRRVITLPWLLMGGSYLFRGDHGGGTIAPTGTL